MTGQCVSQDACQRVGIHLLLDQIVLSPTLNRLRPVRFVILAGEHDDGDLRRLSVKFHERLESSAIGQVQIQKHDINSALGQAFESGLKQPDAFHIKERLLIPTQPVLRLPGFDAVVFDQQNFR